ncbi:MAG TPA: Si-specific NAD(P)(+) transhydrogenase [Thermoanaerobaculia bacterium]|nr:Si-specific NAD(P)(+) transhydrogenase [Thermoanaerobaculia bacterium]
MASAYQYDLVCIGSGPAGQRAAVRAAKLGKRVALIERSQVIGGVCVDSGTIPSKTFREAVLSFVGSCRPFERAAAGASRPTAAQLLGRVGQVVARETAVIERQLGRNDVELIRGEARFLDPHTLAVRALAGPSAAASPNAPQEEGGERRLTAAAVVIAVGTRPAPTPGVPVDGETVITSDEVMGLERIPRSMVVVGAGVIGLEYASMFGALGTEVTLVDRQRRPLEFLDREIVDELIHQMRDNNVLFRGEEAVERLEIDPGPPRRAVVLLESGKRIVSELVLFAVGRIGATDALALPAAGLAADERGRIKVDDSFRTSVPHIFAAGDVIGYPSLAATSSEQGRIAACHALGLPAKPMAKHFPIGVYAIPEVSMVGAPEHELTANKIPYEVGVARYREIARGQILGDDSGFFKMLFHRLDRTLLGVHAIGTGATELIHVGQAVLALGGTLDYFLDTIFNYPTLAECYKVAALDAADKLAC